MNKEKQKQIVIYLATRLAWLILLGLGKSSFVTVRNLKYWRRAMESKRPIIYVLWHGRMLFPAYFHRNQDIVAMVSEHGDGEIIAQTVLRLGYKTVRGSSTRGATKAFRQTLRTLKQGNHCVILPDGPTGPRHVFKVGAVALAQRSNALLLPLVFSAKKPIALNSWDQFTLWWPFTKIALAYGPPISVDRHLSADELETARKDIEVQMNRLLQETDEMV